MGRKQKKRATQGKKISQKSCTTENEDDAKGINPCSCDSLPYASNGEDSENDSESNSMGLEANLKINVEDKFKKKESIYKYMISRMNGQINKYQRLYDYATNRSERIEAEIICLKEDLETSNKKNEELLQSF